MVRPLALYSAVKGSPRQGPVYGMQFLLWNCLPGKSDVQRHLEGSDHKRLAVVVSSCQTISSFVPDSTSQRKVINAEVLFTAFILNIIYLVK